MSDYYLRITDKALIEYPMELDHEYQMTGIITVQGANKKSDEEGGFDYTYQAKFTSHIALVKGDKIIKAKDKKRWSQKLRNVLAANGVDYEDFMPWLFAEELDTLMARYVAQKQN